MTAVDSLTDFVVGSVVMGTEECIEEEVATMSSHHYTCTATEIVT